MTSASDAATPSAPAEVRRRGTALLGGHVSWLEAGEPEAGRPTFLLLHGIPASAELWRGVLAHLGANGRHAIAPDLPGSGRTRIDHSRDHGIEGAVDLVEALQDELELGPVWLVGHDLGAVAAQLLATEHASRLVGVTLSHAPIEDRWPPAPMQPVFAAARRGLGRVVGPALARSVALGVQQTGAYGIAGEPWRAADARRVFLEGKVGSPQARATFARHVTAVAHANNELTRRTAPNLGSIEVPTQLVWGTADRAQPWKGVGDRLRELLPAPAVTVLEGAGHFVPGERPAQFAAALLTGPAAGAPAS